MKSSSCQAGARLRTASALLATALILPWAAAPASVGPPVEPGLGLNDIVVIGTHNSYKLAIPSAVAAAMGDRARPLDYAHRSLAEQLQAGARQLELDVYHDPQGGRFAEPARFRAAGLALEPARLRALKQPGFKVFHAPDSDVLSSCVLLIDCLREIRDWSKSRPDHVPILLMFNTKTDRSSAPGGVDALPFDAAAFDALEAEIRSVISDTMLITPDKVQGKRATLREAVTQDGWPTLAMSRGKVVFALDEPPERVATYRGERKNLEGRVFFVNAPEDSPVAAYLTLNDPLAQHERIRNAVKAGFLVRTRADAATSEARVNDVRRRDAAFASGAQYISTDYMWPDPRFPGGYQVRLPQIALCNPVTAPQKCGPEGLE